MQSSSPKLPLALVTGIAGAAVSSVCVAVTGVTFFASSGALDPSLLAALAPLAPGFFLVLGTVVALTNGALWFLLVWMKGERAIPWMLLSLVGACAAPYAIALGAVVLQSESPEAHELFWCCGIPGVMTGLLALAFWFARSRASPGDEKEKLSRLPELVSPRRARPSPGGERGKGITSFWRGTLISTVTAAVFALLFGVVMYFVFRAGANAPPSSGGFGIDLSGLDTAIYVLISLAGAGTATLLTSLMLMCIVVVPMVPTKTGRIINPILFTLVSVILNLVLDMVIYTALYLKSNPIH